LDWIRRFIIFHNKKHPREMGVPEVTEFIIHLATKGNVSASTHALQRGRLAVKPPLNI
ncbi:MAG: phage integrase N-terminal SAM-like domain-containing protein, partial [Anaerolineales bacterium]|nr:phage integrase N-terminal SAM-like domain-containing protein [Anaerolineales bacterium]